jgi:hypothetical protein
MQERPCPHLYAILYRCIEGAMNSISYTAARANLA